MKKDFNMIDIQIGNKKYIEVNPANILLRQKQKRLLRSDIILASDFQSYSICVEVLKEWFFEKFEPNYFNSIYVDGGHSFDEFRKFADIKQQIKRTNPIAAMVPNINVEHNRNWIDSFPEQRSIIMRRSRLDGCFFNDDRDNRGLHLMLIPKTILMECGFKIRLDTKAEAMDMLNAIKYYHRAGYTENRELCLDVHVPEAILRQIAFDNGFSIDNFGHIVDTIGFLKYMNTYSYIPFIYKMRCQTGNNEYFIKIPNCWAHITTEMPSMDDGEKQGMVTTNYNVNLNVTIEMTAPHSYSYFSQSEQRLIEQYPKNADTDIIVAKTIMDVIPKEDENHWQLYTTTEWQAEESDLNTCINIDFRPLFKSGEIKKILDYTVKIGLSPQIFLNFIFINNGQTIEYDMDWYTLTASLKSPISRLITSVGIYVDMGYINDTLIHVKDLEHRNTRIH